MRLIKMTMVECDALSEGVIRSYDTDIRGSALADAIRETRGGVNLGLARMARVTNSFIRPASNEEEGKSLAWIDGGWSERRIMFSMLVEVEVSRRQSNYEFIVGFTDRSDYTQLGRNVRFDPKMRLYFNSITRVQMSEQVWKGGESVWVPRIKAHDQVLNRNALTAGKRVSQWDNSPALLRPVDMFQRQNTDLGFADILKKRDIRAENTTARFMERITANSRLNNIPAHYVNRVVDAYTKSASDPTGGVDDLEHDRILEDSVDKLEENILESDPYLERIRRNCNILESGYITFEELLEMNPDIDPDKMIPFKSLKGRGPRDQVRWRGDAVTSDEPESIAAYMIAQALPSFMINSMISRVEGLTIRSHTRPGEPKVLMAEAFPYVPGMKIESRFPYFESCLEDILITDLSHNGNVEVEAYITADIDGMIEIDIRLDGGEEACYSFPSFADGLMSPVMTASMDHADMVSQHVVEFASSLTAARMERAPTHTDRNSFALDETPFSKAVKEKPSSRDW